MDQQRGPAAGSGNSGDFPAEMVESLRFQEEIQSLMRESMLDSAPDNNGSSFTALLGLPPNQAMELLHHEPPPPPQGAMNSQKLPFRCSPTFPSNAALVERAARYSVFASEDSPESCAVPSNSANSSPKVKSEPADSDSNPLFSYLPGKSQQPRNGKRKEPEKSKVKSGGKRSKSSSSSGVEEGAAKTADEKSGEKLPYVHVRARRGQATDSHSLAERARREKINARMKLLQELVPGCSKISGTALVLDEIINHVQSLQRQVEFLSMRLAAVNPRIDFSGLDSLLAAENARLTGGNGGGAAGMEPSLWPEVQLDGVRRQQQQIWQVDLHPSHQSSSLWERDDHHHHHHGFISPGPSLFGYESANPVALHANQLKTEL